jgi:hypothetical protein
MLRRYWLVGIFCASLGTSIGCQGSFESADVNGAGATSNEAGSPSLRAVRNGFWGHRLTGGTSGTATGSTPGTGGTVTGGQTGGTPGTGGVATGGVTGGQTGGTPGTGGVATGGTTGTGGAAPVSGTGGTALTATGGSPGGSGTCGNGKVDPGEACDGSALQGATCASLGFSGGSVACSSACQLNVSACTGGTITPTVTASRTTCAAPCSVFFDATTTTGLAGNDYVQANWSWDFNDPTSAHKGTIGFVVAHVFDNPGTYHVTTRVRDTAGSAASTTTTITVSAMSGTTYYVAASGNDSNTGTSTSAPFQTFAHAMTLAGTNKSILLRRGDTFSIGSGSTTMAVTGPFLIGSYSDPAAPSTVNPVLNSTNSTAFSSVFNLSGGSDQRFTDLHIVVTSGFTMFNITNAPTSLFERLDIEGWTQNTGGNGWVLGAPFQTNETIVDCHAHNYDGYSVYADRSVNFAMIGTRGDTFTNHDHFFRLQGGSSNTSTSGQFTHNSYVAENTCAAPTGSTASCGQFRGDNTNSVFVNNTLNRVMDWSPQDPTFVEHVSMGLGEGNTFYDADYDPNYGCMGIIAQHIAIRNNVGVNAEKMVQVLGFPAMPANWTDQIFIYNNTSYSSATTSSPTYLVQIGGGGGVEPTTGSVTVRNNVHYTTSSSNQSSIYVDYGGSAKVVSDHNDLYAPAGGSLSASNVGTGGVLTDPKFVSNGANYQLQASSPARNTGTSVPVYQDMASATRPQETLWDMGAYEYTP